MFHKFGGTESQDGCPQTTTFQEKGEPKRIRTEAPPLTSLKAYHYATIPYT